MQVIFRKDIRTGFDDQVQSNLLAELDVQGMFFADFSIKRIERDKNGNLHALGEAGGSRKSPQLRTLVKGITLHRFALERSDGRYKASVVVDV